MHNIASIKQQSSCYAEDTSIVLKSKPKLRFNNTRAPVHINPESLMCQPSTDQEPENDQMIASVDALIGSSNNNSDASMLDRQGMLTFGNFANLI